MLELCGPKDRDSGIYVYGSNGHKKDRKPDVKLNVEKKQGGEIIRDGPANALKDQDVQMGHQEK